MAAALVALPAVFLPNNLVHRLGPFAVAFVAGQFADFIARSERTNAVTDELPSSLWVAMLLLCLVGWLQVWVGPAAMRTPVAFAFLGSMLYLALEGLAHFDLSAALHAPADEAIEVFEAVAILLPFCFACRWVLY